MSAWNWLAGVLAVVGLLAVLYGLDRLGLWLEPRGWLYYRHKKPTSSPASAWVGLHQLIEPGARYAREVRDEMAAEGGEGAALRWLAASLRAALGAGAVSVEEVRSCLALAKRGGLDWQRLYEEAVREVVLARPDRAALLPPVAAVAPYE
jgi:predicted aminopeptidase